MARNRLPRRFVSLFATLFALVLLSCTSEPKVSGAASPLASDSQKFLLSAAGAKASARKALVIVSYLEGCPILRRYYPELRSLESQFSATASFIFLANGGDQVSAKKEIRSYGVDFPLVNDAEHRVTKELGIRTASEVAVVTLPEMKLVYRGAIDDAITFDFQRPHPENRFLRDVLAKVSAGQSLDFSSTRAFGCTLTLDTKRAESAQQ
jgi:hypothetical protein